MGVITDTLATFFSVSGVATLINAYQAVQAAETRLMNAQQAVNATMAGTAARRRAVTNLNNALASASQAAAAAELATAGVIAGVGVAALSTLTSGLREAISAYVEFGRQVSDIKDLTGASAKEAAQAAELFRVAGVKDATAVRDFIRLSKDFRTAQGNSGLLALGISPTNMNGDAMALFDQIANKLNAMQDGVRKTQIMEELFGARGATAMLPLLRMTEEQRHQVQALGDAFNSEGLAAIQEFTFASNLLGETLMVKVAYPIAQRLLPILTGLTNAVIGVLDAFGRINEATHGILGMALAFGAVGTAIGAIMIAIPPLIAALSSLAVVEAVVDAFAGQWQNLAAGLAIGAIAGIGLGALSGSFNSPMQENTSALQHNNELLAQNNTNLARIADTFLKQSQGGIPKGFQSGDVNELLRQMALGAIG